MYKRFFLLYILNFRVFCSKTEGAVLAGLNGGIGEVFIPVPILRSVWGEDFLCDFCTSIVLNVGFNGISGNFKPGITTKFVGVCVPVLQQLTKDFYKSLEVFINIPFDAFTMKVAFNLQEQSWVTFSPNSFIIDDFISFYIGADIALSLQKEQVLLASDKLEQQVSFVRSLPSSANVEALKDSLLNKSLFIIAPSGSGKSEANTQILNVLKEAGVNCHEIVLNSLVAAGHKTDQNSGYFQEQVQKMIDQASSFEQACSTVLVVSEFYKSITERNDFRINNISSLINFIDGSLHFTYKGKKIKKEDCKFRIIANDSCSSSSFLDIALYKEILINSLNDSSLKKILTNDNSTFMFRLFKNEILTQLKDQHELVGYLDIICLEVDCIGGLLKRDKVISDLLNRFSFFAWDGSVIDLKNMLKKTRNPLSPRWQNDEDASLAIFCQAFRDNKFSNSREVAKKAAELSLNSNISILGSHFICNDRDFKKGLGRSVAYVEEVVRNDEWLFFVRDFDRLNIIAESDYISAEGSEEGSEEKKQLLVNAFQGFLSKLTQSMLDKIEADSNSEALKDKKVFQLIKKLFEKYQAQKQQKLNVLHNSECIQLKTVYSSLIACDQYDLMLDAKIKAIVDGALYSKDVFKTYFEWLQAYNQQYQKVLVLYSKEKQLYHQLDLKQKTSQQKRRERLNNHESVREDKENHEIQVQLAAKKRLLEECECALQYCDKKQCHPLFLLIALVSVKSVEDAVLSVSRQEDVEVKTNNRGGKSPWTQRQQKVGKKT